MRISRKSLGIGITAILLALLLFPFETMVVPEWNLRIVDETGKKVSSVPVTESWSHYVLEKNGHYDEQVTDAEGYVRFPRRGIRANLISRTSNYVLSTLNVHGGKGPAAWVSVMGDYRPVSDEPYYVPGRTLGAQTVVKRAVGPPSSVEPPGSPD
jgi:hypothetical protein